MCRPLRPNATGIFRASPSMAAWVGRRGPGTLVGLSSETAVSRSKRVIGDALRSRTDQRRRTETAIAVNVLNRMLELGRPKSLRIA